MSEPLQGLLHLVRRHRAGTVLFREGEPGEKMFLIRAGKVNIVKRIADSEITLAVLGPGEFFGEMALLEKLPRSAGATVAEDAQLIEVEEEHFQTLVRKSGEIAIRMLRRLSRRLREAGRQIQSLMGRSGAARALTLLRTLAEPPDAQGTRWLPAGTTLDQLAARAGLKADEAEKVARIFQRVGLLTRRGDRLALGPEQLLNEFLLYVDLQERYDPLDVSELAEMAGLREQEAHAIAKRVLAARLAEARGEDAYTTYLSLKQRFEYA
jgi:CRP/FNR family transcriptional regulator, cyclic AMP receptor protein